MHEYNIFRLRCHEISDFVPANCCQNVDPVLTIAGRYVARKYDVPPSIADLVAQLAGFDAAEGLQ